jgi:hypothetical protein
MGNRPCETTVAVVVVVEDEETCRRLYSTQQSIYDLMLLTKSFLHLLLLKLVSEECDQNEKIVCLVCACVVVRDWREREKALQR